MKFTHLVKHNGVYYSAGEDVPIENEKSEGVKAPAPLVSGKADENAFSPYVLYSMSRPSD